MAGVLVPRVAGQIAQAFPSVQHGAAGVPGALPRGDGAAQMMPAEQPPGAKLPRVQLRGERRVSGSYHVVGKGDGAEKSGLRARGRAHEQVDQPGEDLSVRVKRGVYKISPIRGGGKTADKCYQLRQDLPGTVKRLF